MKYEGKVKPRPHETLDEYASRCREQALLVIRHTASLDLADRVVVRIEKGISGIIGGGWAIDDGIGGGNNNGQDRHGTNVWGNSNA